MDYGLPKYQEIEENVKIPLMEVDLAFGPEDGPIIVGRNDFDSFNKLIDTIGAKMAFVQYDWILPPWHVRRHGGVRHRRALRRG